MISCVLPTYNRPGFLAAAVAMFQRQTYPDKELIIVDEGWRPPDSRLWHMDFRIRHVQVRDHEPIGVKRNIGNMLAEGEYIAHWDDDDWYDPDRLMQQVAILQETGAPLTGQRSPLYIDTGNGDMWRYTGPGSRNWVTMLAYPRETWEQRKFGKQKGGFDTVWQRGIEPVATNEGDLTVCLAHEANNSRKNFDPSDWSKVWPDQLRAELLARLDGYRLSLRENGVVNDWTNR